MSGAAEQKRRAWHVGDAERRGRAEAESLVRRLTAKLREYIWDDAFVPDNTTSALLAEADAYLEAK